MSPNIAHVYLKNYNKSDYLNEFCKIFSINYNKRTKNEQIMMRIHQINMLKLIIKVDEQMGRRN